MSKSTSKTIWAIWIIFVIILYLRTGGFEGSDGSLAISWIFIWPFIWLVLKIGSYMGPPSIEKGNKWERHDFD